VKAAGNLPYFCGWLEGEEICREMIEYPADGLRVAEAIEAEPDWQVTHHRIVNIFSVVLKGLLLFRYESRRIFGMVKERFPFESV
jgi:hypothetical protein